MSQAPEFSRPVRIDQIGADARPQSIAADEAERLALSRRFRLRGLGRLEADYLLVPVAGGWQATGTIRSEAVQACAATGQDVPEWIEAPFAIRFVREDGEQGEDEVELSEADCDIMPVEDGRIDMGEAVAQTLALNLDPYPRSPDADAFLRRMGVKREGETGALSGLKDLLSGGSKG
ncbi:MAG: DUF177 domain-containing protein [Sphingobium sp.]